MASWRDRVSTTLVALGTVWSFTPATAQAATYHVSPLGSNTPPYDTYQKAAHKIADALLAAGGYGDTVLIHAGTYTVDTVHHVPSGLVLAGVGRDSATIIWDDHLYEGEPGLIFALGQDNEVLGLELSFPPGSSVNGAVSALSVFAPDTLRIHHCLFRDVIVDVAGDRFLDVYDNEFRFGVVHGGLYIGMARAHIHDNRFYGKTTGRGASIRYSGYVTVEHNVFANDSIWRPIGIFVDHVTQATIRNNLFLNTEAPVYWLFASGTVENNTIVGAVGTWGGWPLHHGVYVFLRWYESITVRNNACIDFQAPWDFGNDDLGSGLSTGPIHFVHNTFWPPRDTMWIKWPQSNPDSVLVIDSANTNAYPMFADDSIYCLQAGSPLINAGDPAILDGDGSRSDVGQTGGPYGIGCAYEQLAPLPPDSLRVSGQGAVVRLDWSRRPEADLAGYRLYRGTQAGFWQPGSTPIREVPANDTSSADTIVEAGSTFYYVATAMDTAGMESGASPEAAYVFSSVPGEEGGTPPLPRDPCIARVYPNPTNAAFIIEVSLPEAMADCSGLSVGIYDVSGRQVIALDAGETLVGRCVFRGDTGLTTGVPLASGVYFARLRSGGRPLGQPVKLVILK